MAVLGLLALAGCLDQAPTSSDPRLNPIEAFTFEVILPFDAFARDFQLCCSPRIGGFRGYGTKALLDEVVIAGKWGGDVDVRTLLRFPALPKELEIFLEGFDTPVFDSLYTLDHGVVVLKIDPLQYEGEPPFAITISETLTDWDVKSATWDFAVDTLGGQVSWTEPGGGPSRILGTVLWDPAVDSDTIAVEVDAETILRWSDLTRADRGVVVSLGGPDHRLVLTEAWLVAWVDASVEPGVLNSSKISGPQVTQIYHPNPEPSIEGFQIGGAPSRRAALRIELPEMIDPPAEVCEIVACPIQLRDENVVYAALRLHSRTTTPFGLAPRVPIALELRTLLAPERFPRSPLGFDADFQGATLDPDAFTSDPEVPADLAMTQYLRNLLREPTEGDVSPLSTLTIRTTIEPAGLGFATFWGPGTALEPTLRLVLTISSEIPLP
jgi:hypothetical protein